MNRLVNDFVIEIPEISIDINAISDEWINANKPKNRYAFLKGMPEEPVVRNFISLFNQSVLNQRTIATLMRYDPYSSINPHIDTSRNVGINLVLRGNCDSTLKFYSSESVVYEYQYQNYPVLVSTKTMHSFSNGPDERVLLTVFTKPELTFQYFKDLFDKGEQSKLFS